MNTPSLNSTQKLSNNLPENPPNNGHRPRKRFAQNFLTNQAIAQQIAFAINPKPGDNLVEIGPGKGAITEHLVNACPNLNAIELDWDLVPLLRQRFAHYPGLKIHQADALKFDFAQLTAANQPLRIVGNLPYNISTALIFHLLSYHHLIKDMYFMLQKEVVKRICAAPAQKAYGRLSVMTQYYCAAEYLLPVPPTSFSPQPKVDSAVIRLTPHPTITHPADNVDLLQKLVNTAFQQRRKTLRNALKQLLPAQIIESLDIDTSIRPENLSPKDFVRLSNTLNQLNHQRTQTP